ncbi:MAG TPA: ATP F0F1 synthase subunit B [Rhizomicrobium sp.]|nr:ATP F0F1 synthase subunit B [Rhizomicrobium sp.]
MMEFLADAELWVALGFFTVIGIMLYFRVPAFIGAALDARAAAISRELEEATRLRTEAASLLAEYKRKAQNAEAEAQTIITEAKAEAERFSVEAREQLTRQIARRGQIAQDKIAQAEQQAMAEIRALAADTATKAAEKLITAQMNETRSASLIASSIKALPNELN